MKFNELTRKKILILGFGREGMDTFRFLRKMFPGKVLGVADRLEIENLELKVKGLIKKDKKVKLHFGENYLRAIKDYDIIIKSPGVPIHLLEIEKAFRMKKITSQTEIFFENYPGKIIGITGSKGKSTTASLIHSILKEGGIKAHLAGNIGKPVLSFLLRRGASKEVCVYELSCHQLYDFREFPDIAVLLNIYPEHLDYYKKFKEYLRTKQNITRYQKTEDHFVFNPKDVNACKTAKISKAKKIPINIKNIRKIIKTKEIPLRGNFNFLNVAAAIEVGKIFKIKKEKMAVAIKNFKPLPHRFEFVGVFKGIKFYNDSMATMPESTISAIDTLRNEVETIFLGGYEKNLDFTGLAKRVLKSKIKTLILFPTTGEKIWKRIVSLAKNKRKLPTHFFVNNMKEAVKIAYQNTEKRKVCLLSCASASFGIFKDYRERGNLFKKYVKFFGSSEKKI